MNTVDPEKLHLTLYFLGNIDNDSITELQDSFVNITNKVNISEFTCNVDDLGVFPHVSCIEVIWAGVKPYREINELHMNYTEHMKFTNEGYEGGFVPHIALGRAKQANNQESSCLQTPVCESDPSFGSFKVRNVRLKKSIMPDEESIYEDIAVCEL